MTDGTNPVMRVALALHRRDDRWSKTPFSALPAHIQEMFVADAQAALEAMPDGSIVLELRDIAEDDRYSNEMLGIALRNWFHRNAAALAKVSGVSK